MLNKLKHVCIYIVMGIDTYKENSSLTNNLYYKLENICIRWVPKTIICLYVILFIYSERSLLLHHLFLKYYTTTTTTIITLWYMMIHILNLFFFFNIGTVHTTFYCYVDCRVYLNVFMHILNENTLILHSYNIIVKV